jgi:hypothetical protein
MYILLVPFKSFNRLYLPKTDFNIEKALVLGTGRSSDKVFFYAKTCFREVQAIDRLKIKRMHIDIYKIVTAPFGT